MAKGNGIRRWLLCPEIGEAPLATVLAASQGGFTQRRLPTLAMVPTVDEIAARIKRLMADYQGWVGQGDISAHRPCPTAGCTCRFRHRHGYTPHFVVCGNWEVRVDLLRLLCPKCKATETLLPDWMRRYSPYPWPLQEAAVLHYVSGPAGYRPVASLFGVDYTVLWGWVRRLAAVAVELAGVVVRELLEQEPDAALDLEPIASGAVLHKARTEEKRLGLAHIPLLARGAEALRVACRNRAELPAGEAGGALGWLSRYLPLHAVPSHLWIGSHRRSHSVLPPAPP